MSDWKEEIQRRFDIHVKRRQEVHAALLSALNELPMGANLDMVDEADLVWNVTVANKRFQVSNVNVDEAQRATNDTGNKEDARTIDVNTAVKEVLLRRLYWAH